jgi:hypothetical protein
MNDIDFTLCDIPMLVSRNKNTSYRESIVSRHTVLMRFLKAHDLIRKEPFNEDGTLKMDLILKQSDVDARCLELYRKAIPGWHAFLDRGGKLDNISRLEKALAQLAPAQQP